MIKYTIPLLALILLVPTGIGNTFAQGGPGEEDFTENIGPVGVVVDEYTASYNEISGWLDVGESPYALVNELPIISVGSLTGQNLMIGIAEDDINLQNKILETFQSLYPNLDINVEIIGEGEWLTGESVSICTSKTDDCNPQLSG